MLLQHIRGVNMDKSGEFEYHYPSEEEYMADPWAWYNEDCDPGFQGPVIIDVGYLNEQEVNK